MKKIAFVPIDNRPVCYCLPKQIIDFSDDYEIFLPPRNLLGGLKTNADAKKILEWLKSVENPDYIVIALDTIAYGGLINSRKSEDVYERIVENLENLKNILSKKTAKVFAFSSIMRISNNNINEEEKTYWSQYGKKIFDYSYNKHRAEALFEAEAQNKCNCIKNTLPKAIIDDYTQTRERNFNVNKYYLEWLKNGILDFIVYSKDDCAQYGFNVKEAQILQQMINDENLDATVKTGADEIPLTLLSKVFTDNKTIKIKTIFTQPEFTSKISKYEDISVKTSVSLQIELAGAIETENEQDADLILLVNNFKNEQGELVMGVYEEGFYDQFELPKKPYFIADILNANGADNSFVATLFNKNQSVDTLYGYAGWNTTSNTLGSVIAISLSRLVSKSIDIRKFNLTIFTRFLDDWAYQSNVRQQMKTTNCGLSEDTVKELMVPYENILKNFLKTDFSDIVYEFPWDRFFEIECKLSA